MRGGRTLSHPSYTCCGGQSPEGGALPASLPHRGEESPLLVRLLSQTVSESADAAAVFGLRLRQLGAATLRFIFYFTIRGFGSKETEATVLLRVSVATASITRNHRKLEVYLYIKIHENTKSSKKNNRAKNRMKSVTPSERGRGLASVFSNIPFGQLINCLTRPEFTGRPGIFPRGPGEGAIFAESTDWGGGASVRLTH